MNTAHVVVVPHTSMNIAHDVVVVQAKIQFSRIVHVAAGSFMVDRMMGTAAELQADAEWACHHTAVQAVEGACGKFDSFSLKYIATIANMCKVRTLLSHQHPARAHTRSLYAASYFSDLIAAHLPRFCLPRP